MFVHVLNVVRLIAYMHTRLEQISECHMHLPLDKIEYGKEEDF